MWPCFTTGLRFQSPVTLGEDACATKLRRKRAQLSDRLTKSSDPEAKKGSGFANPDVAGSPALFDSVSS
jgi:hypothetical protein